MPPSSSRAPFQAAMLAVCRDPSRADAGRQSGIDSGHATAQLRDRFRFGSPMARHFRPARAPSSSGLPAPPAARAGSSSVPLNPTGYQPPVWSEPTVAGAASPLHLLRRPFSLFPSPLSLVIAVESEIHAAGTPNQAQALHVTI